MPQAPRPLTHLVDDIDDLRARCAGLAETSFGLAMIFATLVLAAAMGGVWLRQPLLATSAAFALVAAAAFVILGDALARAAAQAPKVRVIAQGARRRD